MDYVDPVRAGRARPLGWQRGSLAGLSRRDDPGGTGHKGCPLDAANANAHRRLSHAVLFPPCRDAREPSSLVGSTDRISCLVGRKSRLQDLRLVSVDRGVPPGREGTMVLHPLDVDRTYIWYD